MHYTLIALLFRLFIRLHVLTHLNIMELMNANITIFLMWHRYYLSKYMFFVICRLMSFFIVTFLINRLPSTPLGRQIITFFVSSPPYIFFLFYLEFFIVLSLPKIIFLHLINYPLTLSKVSLLIILTFKKSI